MVPDKTYPVHMIYMQGYMYGSLQNLCYSNFRRNHVANKYRSQIEYTRNADEDFTTPGGATAANSGKMGILKSELHNWPKEIYIAYISQWPQFFLDFTL